MFHTLLKVLDFMSLRSLEDENFVLEGIWFMDWNDIRVQEESTENSRKRNGKLTLDTQQALEHTLFTVLEIIEYLKTVWNLHYILLGKFQIDPLEVRFGQHRQMSGGCYHDSVVQILESEKKLKRLALSLFSASQKEIKMSELCITDEFSQQQSTRLCNETPV